MNLTLRNIGPLSPYLAALARGGILGETPEQVAFFLLRRGLTEIFAAGLIDRRARCPRRKR